MAKVTIKITSAKGSTVKVFHPANEGRKALRVSLSTTWTKPEWDAMRTDSTTALVAAKSLGVTVDELRAGIATMQERVKYYGPAVYQAPCGHEVYKRQDGPRAEVLKDVLIAWKGHPAMKTEWLRTDREIPQDCKGCKRLCFRQQSYAPEIVKDLVTLDMWWCSAHTIVPGAVPPPEKTEEAR